MRPLVLAVVGIALALPAAAQSTNPPPAVDNDSRVRKPGAAPATTSGDGGRQTEPKGGILWDYQPGAVKGQKDGKQAPGK